MTSRSSSRGRHENLGHRVASSALALSALPLGLLALRTGAGAVNTDAAVARTVFPLAAGAAVLVLAGFAIRQVRSSLLGWSLLLATSAAIVACAIYVVHVSSLVAYRADILSWSESPFVQDIVHLRTGQPLYSDPTAASSFFYPPMTQVATYGLASLVGAATSIPVYRAIQLLWLVLASAFGVAAVGGFLELAGVSRENPWTRFPVLSRAFTGAFLFLVATNPTTSPFAHNLHHDSLAILVSAIALFVLARYAKTRDLRWLLVLGALPALGFLVKQSLAIWSPLGAMAVFVVGGPRGWRRAVVFGVASLALVAAVNIAAIVTWGPAWSYWVIDVLKAHRVSPLRSVQHVADAWVMFTMLIASALVLIRSPKQRPLAAVWIACFALLAIEAYTSGIAWMLNHMAPGSFVAGAWGVAALLAAWPAVLRDSEPVSGGVVWRGTRALGMTGVALLVLCGVGAARIPVPGLPPDADRYRQDLENAVTDALQVSDRVLLDHGSWVFLPRGQSVGDRSAAIGELGITGMSDFAATRQRIRSHYYSRILVRDYHTSDFFYDLPLWPRSSGISRALEESYKVVGTIPRVQGDDINPFFGTVSILAPRDDGNPGEGVRQ